MVWYCMYLCHGDCKLIGKTIVLFYLCRGISHVTAYSRVLCWGNLRWMFQSCICSLNNWEQTLTRSKGTCFWCILLGTPRIVKKLNPMLKQFYNLAFTPLTYLWETSFKVSCGQFGNFINLSYPMLHHRVCPLHFFLILAGTWQKLGSDDNVLDIAIGFPCLPSMLDLKGCQLLQKLSFEHAHTELTPCRFPSNSRYFSSPNTPSPGKANARCTSHLTGTTRPLRPKMGPVLPEGLSRGLSKLYEPLAPNVFKNWVAG